MAKKGIINIACPKCLSPMAITVIKDKNNWAHRPVTLYEDYQKVEHFGHTTCKACGLPLTSEQCKRLVEASTEVSYWAWQYGKAFWDELREKGTIRERYILEAAEVLTYLASVIGAAIIGNASYDAAKSLCLRIIKRLKDKRALPEEITGESEEETFDSLYALAEAFLHYQESPFGQPQGLEKVFRTLRYGEPSRFIHEDRLHALLGIFKKYNTAHVFQLEALTRDNVDFLLLVLLIENHIKGDEVLDLLAARRPQKASQQLHRYLTQARYLDESTMRSEREERLRFLHERAEERLRNVPADDRDLSFILEVIENAILAVDNLNDATVSIDIKGNSVSVADNGVGMSYRDIFYFYLYPHESGWFSLGHLKPEEHYEHGGFGLKRNLLSCDELIVESRSIAGNYAHVALSFGDGPEAFLWFPEETNQLFQNRGTKVSLQLSIGPRWPAFSRCGLWKWTHQEIEEYIKSNVSKYCKMVDDRVQIFLNGSRLNTSSNRGNGPYRILLDKFPERLDELKDIPIDVYWADSSIERDRNCLYEIYHNGLYVGSDDLFRRLREAEVDIESVVLHKLNKKIIRFFLPPTVHLAWGKSTLPSYEINEGYLAKKLIELVLRSESSC